MKSTPKSDATRSRILEAAMELFRHKGFDATTMRDIAAEAGMATGAAYYYFDSKDAIVLAFYHQAQNELAPLLDEALHSQKDLKEGLRALLEVKLRYFEPNRRLLAAIAAHTDPAHPLSPFGEQTSEIRGRDLQYFERALSASRLRVPPDLQACLPRILWMYQMGIILFWIHDRSAGQKRTSALLDQSIELVIRLIKLAGFPLAAPVRKRVVNLVASVSDGS